MNGIWSLPRLSAWMGVVIVRIIQIKMEANEEKRKSSEVSGFDYSKTS